MKSVRNLELVKLFLNLCMKKLRILRGQEPKKGMKIGKHSYKDHEDYVEQKLSEHK